MATQWRQDFDTLEQLVDRHGIKGVTCMLSELCGEKAAHIAENWQDTGLAKRWDKNAERIARLSLVDTE